MRHDLKTINPHFSNVWKGLKNFEVRKNDRDFQVGDELWLEEYDSVTEEFSDRCILVRVTLVLDSKDFPDGIKNGYCVLSLGYPKKFMLQDGVYVQQYMDE